MIPLLTMLLCAAGAGRGRADGPSGAQLWQSHCAVCHGFDGRGATTAGRRQKVASMASRSWQKRHDDASIRRAIKQGIRPPKGMPDMPAYDLVDEQVDAVIEHLRMFATRR